MSTTELITHSMDLWTRWHAASVARLSREQGKLLKNAMDEAFMAAVYPDGPDKDPQVLTTSTPETGYINLTVGTEAVNTEKAKTVKPKQKPAPNNKKTPGAKSGWGSKRNTDTKNELVLGSRRRTKA